MTSFSLIYVTYILKNMCTYTILIFIHDKTAENGLFRSRKETSKSGKGEQKKVMDTEYGQSI